MQISHPAAVIKNSPVVGLFVNPRQEYFFFKADSVVYISRFHQSLIDNFHTNQNKHHSAGVRAPCSVHRSFSIDSPVVSSHADTEVF